MQHRKSGRPTGTDGSDFSYRMVVDSRYTRVAKGKSRLYAVILSQVLIQLIGVLFLILPMLKGSAFDNLAVSSAVSGFVALLFGELGRRQSRASFLITYAVVSSAAVLVSALVFISHHSTLRIIENLRDWETMIFQLVEPLLILLRFLVQIFAVSTVISLIRNMAPPRKAS